MEKRTAFPPSGRGTKPCVTVRLPTRGSARQRCKKRSLCLNVALQTKNRNPPTNPGTDEMAGVCWGGGHLWPGKTIVMIVVCVLELVGSQRRRHTQPATDRPVQGTTPSRRRVTPDRPIGGGKGGRRLCGRTSGSAVDLCKSRCKNAREQHKPEPRPTPPKKQEPNHDPTPGTKHRPQPNANDDEEKKNRCGSGTLMYERTRKYGLRTQCVARIEESQGEPQTPRRGFGFPQRLRERKKREKTSPTKLTRQKKKTDAYNHRTRVGSWRAQRNKNKRRPLRNNNGITKTDKNQKSQKHQPDIDHDNFPRGFTPQGGGAHGPPCLLLESHPRGPWYRGVRRPPHQGNRPQWRNNHTTCRTNLWDPKRVGPTLSRSCRTNMTAYNGCSTNRPRQKSRHHTKHKGRIDQNIDHTHHHCQGPFGRFWRFWRAPTKYSTMRQPWRLWRFWQFRRSWRFQSWRLPPLNLTPLFRDPDTCATPHESKAKWARYPLGNTMSKRHCAIYGGGISHWAAEQRERETKLVLLGKTCFLHSRYLPKGSKRCFPNGVFRFLTSAWNRGKPPSEGQIAPENTSVSKHFLPLRILTTLWTHHSEKHRLENTVCYSLDLGTEKQPKEKVPGTDIPQTSRGHSCGRPGSKTLGRPLKPWNCDLTSSHRPPPNTRSNPFKRSRFRVDLAGFHQNWPKTSENRPRNRHLRGGLDRKGGGVCGWMVKSQPWKSKRLGADVHDPRGRQKTSSKKTFQADFSFPCRGSLGLRVGVWPCEHGTICPFGVFPLFHSHFCPYLAGILPALGSGTQIQHLSFSTPKWPFPHSKNTTAPREKMAKFDVTNTIKHGKKRQKDKWLHFHACTWWGSKFDPQ